MTAYVVLMSVLVLAGIAWWAKKNGGRLLTLRAEAVLEWQDCDPLPGELWDGVDAALADQPDEVLTHEALDAEEADHFAVDFTAWRDELMAEPGVARHLRRMERWSA